MVGTMIPAVVPTELREAYRNRLGRVAQNVLAIVDFDMKFIFVYTRWEGSAHDAPVFHHDASDSQDIFHDHQRVNIILWIQLIHALRDCCPAIQENIITGVIITTKSNFMGIKITSITITQQFVIL
ncbi:uncharacterized protein LOC118348713 [Juglans regia]|uniref:Uncharacterized protein LOC118348713 n=1 Tax=Juglans regia TaxID=51240 RepID=A0A6P9EES1_JUGRE|nr:uncharacterized protein LOC118348713 [Juglans regia]